MFLIFEVLHYVCRNPAHIYSVQDPQAETPLSLCNLFMIDLLLSVVCYLNILVIKCPFLSLKIWFSWSCPSEIITTCLLYCCLCTQGMQNSDLLGRFFFRRFPNVWHDVHNYLQLCMQSTLRLKLQQNRLFHNSTSKPMVPFVFDWSCMWALISQKVVGRTHRGKILQYDPL